MLPMILSGILSGILPKILCGMLPEMLSDVVHEKFAQSNHGYSQINWKLNRKR